MEEEFLTRLINENDDFDEDGWDDAADDDDDEDDDTDDDEEDIPGEAEEE